MSLFVLHTALLLFSSFDLSCCSSSEELKSFSAPSTLVLGPDSYMFLTVLLPSAVEKDVLKYQLSHPSVLL